jgi:internalin A
MRKTLLVVCFSSLGILITGCQPAEKPVKPAGKMPAATAEPKSKPDTEVAAAPSPQYSKEQIAAAKRLAGDLGVVVKEDAGGNVILIDTAAERSWVDDYQMQEILVFGGLTSLTVEGPSITNALAPRIAEQTSLVSLALRNTLVGDQGIAQFTALKSLRVIDLRVSPMVTDAAMKTLAKMPQLRAVRLTGCNVTDTGIATLLDLPRLTELDVRNCRGVTARGIEQLTGKETLRVLKIGGPKIDDEVLETVAKLNNLSGLSLDNCDITDAGVAKLAELPLVDLTLYQCAGVTDKGLEVLAGYAELKHLTLRDVPAKGSALDKLPHPEKLVSLNMAQSGITDAEVAGLARMTSLEKLNLSETALTDAAVDTLSKLSSIKQMLLTQTGVSTEGMSRLRKALPECSIRSE